MNRAAQLSNATQRDVRPCESTPLDNIARLDFGRSQFLKPRRPPHSVPTDAGLTVPKLEWASAMEPPSCDSLLENGRLLPTSIIGNVYDNACLPVYFSWGNGLPCGGADELKRRASPQLNR